MLFWVCLWVCGGRKKQVRGAKNKPLRIVFSYIIIVHQHSTVHLHVDASVEHSNQA